jgi:integrase/recombinase XerD
MLACGAWWDKTVFFVKIAAFLLKRIKIYCKIKERKKEGIALEQFLASLEAKKKPNTLLSYRRDLEAFVSGIAPKRPEELTADELVAYFVGLSHRLSSSSLSRAVCVVRGFYAFLEEVRRIGENPMKGIVASRFEKREEVLLSPEEFRRLLSYSAPGIRGRRDRAMLGLLCETGMQVSELVELNRSDLRGETRSILCGRGEKRRELFLSFQTFSLLEEYRTLSCLRSPEEEALFLGSTGRRITRQGFWKNLKERAMKSGVEYCSPQVLRQSFAWHCIRAGEHRKRVRTLLGNRADANLRNYEKQRKGEKQWDC